MQEYVRAEGLKVVVIFEGRDAAGSFGRKRAAELMSRYTVVFGCVRKMDAGARD